MQNCPAGQPIGQVLVKATWNVREVTSDSNSQMAVRIQSRNDGKWYTPTTVAALFMMYKESPSAANDQGWNYDTYDLEHPSKAPVVLNDVRVSSCISCQKKTKYDRVFGVN